MPWRELSVVFGPLCRIDERLNRKSHLLEGLLGAGRAILIRAEGYCELTIRFANRSLVRAEDLDTQ